MSKPRKFVNVTVVFTIEVPHNVRTDSIEVAGKMHVVGSNDFSASTTDYLVFKAKKDKKYVEGRESGQLRERQQENG